ncbi:HD domain-containing protein [Brumicola nitratireducens]|uniref:Metal dependent phosphohydrolase n=1 Tax=Glaciecola nitratireducens (strain JCM 12485 / KCTC 12276 / FR1064) TaxID=1085623 RepID=G4QKZ5_GLANF|nr:HD domain-containing protein [Glaciecola nitratireducens]AEP29385.1 metal dependent phosphohydrolase [Glaciecola nitratireducens FR1064]
MDKHYPAPYRLITALELAAKAHAEQRRKSDHSPYLNHLIDVMSLLVKFGHEDENLLISALLHDVIEDTFVNYEQLYLMFGEEVADTVKGLSDNKLLSIQKRKEEQLEKAKDGSVNHKLIKLSDAVSNASMIPLNWSVKQAEDSINHLKKIADICGDACPDMHQMLLETIDSSMVSLEKNKREIDDKIDGYIEQKLVFYSVRNDRFYLSESDENLPLNVSVMHGKFDGYMRSIRSDRLSFYAKPTVFENINSTVSELGIIDFNLPIETPILSGLMQVALRYR